MAPSRWANSGVSTDLTVSLIDRPGELARLGEALSEAGINIEGLAATGMDGRGDVHVLVADAAAARRALEGAGIEVVRQGPVVLVELPDAPGSFGKSCRALANAGVNIEFAYFASSLGKHVFGVDDPARAEGALAQG
jgi:hypothetical protein